MDKEKYWNKIQSRILRRRQPLSTLHWRFVLPKQDLGIRVHRYVFLRIYKNFPFVLRLLAISFIYTRWWFFFGWIAVYKVHKTASKKCNENHGISRWRQLSDMFAAAFIYCIPPSEYYRMQLHRWPRSSWLEFAFDFQSAAWHSAFSGSKSASQQAIINDKLAFEELLNANNLRSITTLRAVAAGESITTKELQVLPDEVFFKPRVGNLSRGCFVVRRTSKAKQNNLQIVWFKGKITNHDQTLDVLNKIIGNYDYLMQPLLKNHPDFALLFNTDELVTIRLVTVKADAESVAMSALIEIPIVDQPAYYWNMLIDVDSGAFMKPLNFPGQDNEFNKGYRKLAAHAQGKACPYWEDIKKLCADAHELLDQLFTIGWDVALSTDGPVIVEGNGNWSLAANQVLQQKPMLKLPLGKVYARNFDSRDV